MSGQQNFAKLVDYFNKYDGVAVAFSGGMDSSLLLCAAIESQKEKTIALTAKTDFFTWDEWYRVRDITEELGAKNEQLEIEVLTNEEITSNPKDRCYFCKKAIFTKVIEVAGRYNCEIVAEGSNTDDLADYRPGKQAILELQVKSPLLELNFGKEDIKEMLKAIGRGYYILPPNACLATRIKTGEEITQEKLDFIYKAEKLIKPYANGILRVRWDGGNIVVQGEEIKNKEFITEELKIMGAKEITFGKYEKSGSVNAG